MAFESIGFNLQKNNNQDEKGAVKTKLVLVTHNLIHIQRRTIRDSFLKYRFTFISELATSDRPKRVSKELSDALNDIFFSLLEKCQNYPLMNLQGKFCQADHVVAANVIMQEHKSKSTEKPVNGNELYTLLYQQLAYQCRLSLSICSILHAFVGVRMGHPKFNTSYISETMMELCAPIAIKGVSICKTSD